MRYTGIHIFRALCCLFLLPSMVGAQTKWTFKAVPDTSRIRIGEQFSVFLQANIPSGHKVIFPTWSDSLMKGFELVSEGKTDTISNDASGITLRRRWLLTAFDSGYFPVPSLVARLASSRDDSLLSEAFLVSVQTVKVDTTAAIKPIKGPLEPEFSLAEWWKEILAVAIILIIVLLLIWYLKKKKKTAIVTPEPAPHVLPLDWALTELEKLKQENLTAKGMVKEYYVRLSVVVRTFIEMEFGIPALESTTDEIIAALRLSGLQDISLQSIKAVMQLCDLAKFAKANPLQGEHEASFNGAVEFVQLSSNQRSARPGGE